MVGLRPTPEGVESLRLVVVLKHLLEFCLDPPSILPSPRRRVVEEGDDDDVTILPSVHRVNRGHRAHRLEVRDGSEVDLGPRLLDVESDCGE